MILKALAKKRASRFPSVRVMKQAYQAALAGKALPEFDGVPIGPTVRLPPRAAERVESAVVPTPRRSRFTWLALLLVPILGGAAFLGYRILSSAGSPVPESPNELLLTPTNALLTEETIPTVRPSATPAPLPITSDACPGVTLFPLQVEGDRVSWLIDNASEDAIRLTGMELGDWPSANGSLNELRWGESVLAIGPFEDGSALLLQPEIDPSLAAGGSTLFSMRFNFEAGRQGYMLVLSLDAGCTLEGSW